MKRILIGGGGHGRVLVDALRASGIAVDGLLDLRNGVELRVAGVRLLGTDDWLLSQSASAVVLVNGVGANPSIAVRRVLFERWRSSKFAFASVIHPTSVLSPECVLAEGVQILARAVISPGVEIGDNVVVNTGAIVEHDVRLEMHAFVSPGAVICGDVQIGNGAFVGAGAVILPAIRVGAGAIVAAGATVVADVPDGASVAGTPAREQSASAPDAVKRETGQP